MVALKKTSLVKQAKNKLTIKRTKQLISIMKLFLLVMTIFIVITNLEMYKNLNVVNTTVSTAASGGASASANRIDWSVHKNPSDANADADTDTDTAVAANAAANNLSDDDESNNIHVVFSTSCSLSHDWQSYLFFFHAMLHKQKGDVTRIVSGCSKEDEITMQAIHDKQFKIMSSKFLLHFTPEFGKQLVDEGISFQKTKYWNKPFGLKHWMVHRFGYVWNDVDDTLITVPEYDDHIIVLVDPDMLMQKPFINDFSNVPLDQWNKYYRIMGHSDELVGKVKQGHPAAQDYSFGTKWLNPVREHLDDIVGPNSLVHDVTQDEAQYAYAAGPPYWMTARDAFRISYKWSEFLPLIFKYHPVFMAEMYGYCMASAYLGLKHQMARGMMVSNVGMTDGEGWSFLNKNNNACDVSIFKDTVPNVIHFCQRYSIGEYFINKYLFPTDILSCDFPLLELPSKNILHDTWYSHYGDGSIEEWSKEKDDIKRYRNAFMICSLFPAINSAAKFYKDQHCDKNDPNTIYDATYNHFRSDKGKELEQRGLQSANKKKESQQRK
jgi:hypothetical protein